MSRRIRADGDRWRVRLGQQASGPDVRTVLFFCETTGQRPYRVVEVPRDRIDGPEELEALSERELMELFRASRSLDFPRTYA